MASPPPSSSASGDALGGIPGLAELQAGFMRHLEELRLQNLHLAEQLNLLRQQQQQQPGAVPGRVPALAPKPERFDGKGNLEGWLSTTRDILVTCYNLAEDGREIVTTASLYLAGNARNSWDAMIRSGGAMLNWQQFAAWLRQTHGSVAPQVVQGQLLLRLKQEGKSLQEYINKWQSIAAQLPEPLTNEFAKLIFVEGLNDKFHAAATDYRVSHPDCSLQDIVVYLRSVSVQGAGRRLGGQQNTRADRAVPMDVDLKVLAEQVSSLEKRLAPLSSDRPAEVQEFHRLSAEELEECKRLGLCYTCKQPGHQYRQCKVKTKNKGKGRR